MSECDRMDIGMIGGEAVAVSVAQRMNVGLAALIQPSLSPSPKPQEWAFSDVPHSKSQVTCAFEKPASPACEESHLSRIWEEPFDWRIPRYAWQRNECSKRSHLLYNLNGVDSLLSLP
ncbi:hypothetical protein DL96DRAFT_1709899 [Flagelloscypha sp. PMI_526]|nr:hypothetical protein DL96DRAFT_1709899 [Flagelloscypha sp. PMI_526]